MQRISVAVIAVLVTVASTGKGQEPVNATVGAGGPRFLVASSDPRHRVEVAPSTVPILRRRVSLAVDRVTVSGVLERIGRQLDVRFSYDPALGELDRQLTVRFDRLTLAAVLTEVLFETGLDVLVADRGHLALVPRAGARASRTGTIVGRATDAKSGQGLAGVDVFLDRTKWRAVTDSAGRYSLAGVDPGAYTLIARRLGYAKQSRKVVVDDGRTDTVHVALEAAAVPLDELVTTATGRQRRRDLGNAITTIKADSVLRTAPIRSLTDLLANRVPGMSLQHTSGAPGDPARIRLRGLSSVMRGNDPVVIVDGVRIYAAQSEARSGNLTNLMAGRDGTLDSVFFSRNTPAPSPLDQIDPNIIDKIEVFKGPSAATLYGADAANGVIVITTKKGKPGPTRWAAHLEYGRTTPAGHYPEGYFRFGHVPENGRVKSCLLIDQHCTVDSVVRYQALNDPEMTILGRGHRTGFSLSASGGSQALTYSLTGSYGDETGLLHLPAFEAERFRTRFNREAPDWMVQPHHLKTWSVTSSIRALLGPTADVALLTSLSRSDQQRTGLENQQGALAEAYIDKVYGRYWVPLPLPCFSGEDIGYTLCPNNGALTLGDYYTRTIASSLAFTTSLNASWRPRSWFNATGHAGLNVMPRDDERFMPTGIPSASDVGALTRGTGRSLESTFGIQGTLRKPLKWGFVFETNIGTNLVTQTTNDLVSAATGLVPGTSSLSGAKTFTATDERVNTSVFGWYLEPRISGQRVSLSTGIRLDGGSAYGARITRTGGGLFGGLLGLPKLNGSWVISEEPWFPFNALFSSLRLRGAYGQAQVQPRATDRLRLYQRSPDIGDVLLLNNLGNAELQPERSTEFEGGFDADVVDSRISVEFSAYRKLQVDALMPVQLPSSVHGGGTIIRNIGNIRNTGMEVTTRITPVQSPLATWSAQLNYSRNNNILTKLGNGVAPNPLQGFVAGYPVGGRWSRPILSYADRNGNGAIDAGEVQVGDSLVFMGRLLPAYTMSLFTDLVLFHGALGITAGFSHDAGATQLAKTGWVVRRALFDPTTPLEQQAAAAVRDSTDYGLTEDVSTFRFNSLAVTYHAPASITRVLGAQKLSVSLQGSNLAMHSTYRGKDPDVSAWSPTEQIADTGQLALPRTWQLAIYLDF